MTSFLSLVLLLLLVLLITASIAVPTNNCEANNDNNNNNDSDRDEDSYSCRSEDSDPRRGPGLLVVPVGTKLNDHARFPLTFVGDWTRVLLAPEVIVVRDASEAFWTEGPLVRNSVVYFSDTVRALIYRVSEDTAFKFEVWATHSGGTDPDADRHQPDCEYENVAESGSNGMATDLLDPEFVVINQHGRHRVIKCRLDDHTPGAPLRECPDLQVVTDSFNINSKNNNNNINDKLPFNGPNDVVVHPHDGSIWFTDPIYGLLEKDRFCDEFNCHTGGSYLDTKSAIGGQGVYRVDRDTHKVELVTNYHRRPNGLAFTNDVKRLWVSDSTIGSPSWTAYEMVSKNQNEGTTRDDEEEEDPIRTPPYISSKASDVLTPATLGAILGRTDDLPPLTGGEGLSDGFKIDEYGYLWTSIPNGFAVIDTIQHKVLCQILLGVNTSNLAFGTNGDVWLTGVGGIWKIKRRILYNTTWKL